MSPTPTLKQIATALGIDTPIYRTQTAPNGTVTVYCYGGQVQTYEPPRTAQKAVRDDFTTLPGVGAATNNALHKHGVHTWEALHAQNLRTAQDIKSWLRRKS